MKNVKIKIRNSVGKLNGTIETGEKKTGWSEEKFLSHCPACGRETKRRKTWKGIEWQVLITNQSFIRNRERKYSKRHIWEPHKINKS